MPKPISQLVTGTITLDPADPEVLSILSTLCLTASPIAHTLQRAGYDIPTRAEGEQGAVLLWMLSLYRDHGKEWRERGDEFLRQKLVEASKPITREDLTPEELSVSEHRRQIGDPAIG